MVVIVKLDDLLQAVDWVSGESGFERAAYVCRQSGRVFWLMGEGAIYGEQDELPDDIDDDDKYVPVPQKRDLAISQPGWIALRQELWPHCAAEEHLAEMSAFLAEPDRFAQFVTYDGCGVAVGLIEVAIRTDYVNGADTSPAAFLEGIYVAPEARRSGVARELVAVAERWALGMGCTELLSDAAIENTSSHAMHIALGFVETERVVFFRKVLR